MPRNSSGTYTLPAGNPVAPNTLIETNWANPTMSDLASALTDSLDRLGRGTMLAPLKIFDGTPLAPALSFNSEATTGLFRPAGASLGIAILGSEVARFTAATLELFGGLTVAGALAFTGNLALTGDLALTGNLTTTGAATIGTTLTAAGLFSANGGAVLGDAAADPLLITSNTATLASSLNFTGGPVGIGRTPVGEIFEVARAVASFGSLQSATGPKASLDYLNNSARLASWGELPGTAGAFLFYQASSDNSVNRVAIEVSAAGNVGMGQTPVLRKLEINAIPLAVSQINGIRLQAAATPVYASEFLLGTDAATAPFTSIRTGTDPASFMTFETAAAERMRIDASGNVSIGGASIRNSMLDVQTGVRQGYAVSARFNGANAPLGFGVANSNGFAYIASNARQVSGTDGQVYDVAAAASRIRVDNALFTFALAPAGAAGAAIPWTDRFSIANNATSTLLVNGHPTRFVSTAQAIVPGAQRMDFPHGSPSNRVPDVAFAYLRNKITQFGWVPGDIILLQSYNPGGTPLWQVTAGMTHIFVSRDTATGNVLSTSNATSGITAANWEVFVVAYWF